MTKSKLVMILVIENVEQICEEGVNIVELWESCQDVIEFIVHGILCELDLAHVETSDSAD